MPRWSTTITVKVDADIVPGAGKELSNTATITAFGDAQPADSTANDSDTETTNVVRKADLAISKSDAPDPVVAGTNLVYTLTVTNNGPSSLSGFTVSDTLPSDVTYVSDDSAGLHARCWGGHLHPRRRSRVRCLGLLSDHCQGRLRHRARRGRRSCRTRPRSPPSAMPSRRTAPPTTPTRKRPTSSATPIWRSPRPMPLIRSFSGENITYTITVTNNGPSFSSGFTVTDTLSEREVRVGSAGCTHTGAAAAASEGP